MPLLIVVRHAKSDWTHDVSDEQRPLNARGQREAPLVGPWIAEHVGDLDLVICSTAVRARETLARSGLTGEVRYDPRLYGATPRELMSVVEEVPEDVGAVALVGHNPGLSDLVGVLTGEAVELKTSAVAVVRWEGGWPDVWGRGADLVSHATPRG
jgi:phosphohistidine phosphatase